MSQNFLADIAILTEKRYEHPLESNDYIENLLLEDRLVQEALEKNGLKVIRVDWSRPDIEWEKVRFALFRTTWDYFDRFPEFSSWLDRTSKKTEFINPLKTIHWNLDKHYLLDLEKAGVSIPPTSFAETGSSRLLVDWFKECGWDKAILKPAVSGAGRHTYKLDQENVHEYESLFQELIAAESMMLQEFLEPVLDRGEISLMVFGGKFSHAILKKAKPGDFRVQDDFGGTVHPYEASPEEIAFAENVMKSIDPVPVYGRVDIMWDNQGEAVVSEVELIEPELWFRFHESAADMLADEVLNHIS